MYYSVIGVLLMFLLLVACQNIADSQTSKDATGIPENLVRVDHTAAKLAYVDPNADFSKYTAILLTPLGVDNVEIIQPHPVSARPGIATGSLPTPTSNDCSRIIERP